MFTDSRLGSKNGSATVHYLHFFEFTLREEREKYNADLRTKIWTDFLREALHSGDEAAVSMQNTKSVVATVSFISPSLLFQPRHRNQE